MNNSRRTFLKLASLFTLSGSLPLLQACSANLQADAPLKIGYLPITDATPLLLAHAQGLFAKRGLIVEKPVLFRSWAQLVEAFLSGQVNVIHLLSPMSVWLRYGSQSTAKIVMWNHMAGSALTVGLDIHHLRDLSGKTIAIPFWYSIHNIVLQYLLRQNGLRVSEKPPRAGEVQLVVMSPSDMVAALAGKNIAGFIVAEPFNALAESKGVGKILRFTADVWRDHACCVTIMQQQDIDQRPQWVQSVVDALVEAQIFAQTQRHLVADILAKEHPQHYTPHSQTVLNTVLNPSPEAWQQYQNIVRHPEWHQQRIDFQPYPYPSYSEKMIELLQQTHIAGVHPFLEKLHPQTAAQELTDSQFVLQAIKTQDSANLFRLPENGQRIEELSID